eukprot:2180528-Rhodomonas_salina.1
MTRAPLEQRLERAHRRKEQTSALADKSPCRHDRGHRERTHTHTHTHEGHAQRPHRGRNAWRRG